MQWHWPANTTSLPPSITGAPLGLTLCLGSADPNSRPLVCALDWLSQSTGCAYSRVNVPVWSLKISATFFSVLLFSCFLVDDLIAFLFFFLNWIFYLFTFQMLFPFPISPSETFYPIPSPPTSMRVYPLPTQPLPLPHPQFPYIGALSLHWTKGFSSHRCPTRPSFATYVAGAMHYSMCTPYCPSF